MSNVGFATLSVIPSARGFGGQLGGQLRPQMGAAGAAAGGVLGGSLVKGAAKFAGPLAAVFGAISFVGLVKDASALDASAREVVTLLGQAGPVAQASLGQVRSDVRALSDEFGIAQETLTTGLYNAISAGVPQENAFTFMQVASKASIAGVTDVNTAVDGLTTTVNAFGLEIGDAGAVSDSMFAAVQGGKTTFGELSDSLFNIGPAASAAGVGFEEVNAGIATLTAGGTPTAVATTQLRAALTGLQRPSEELDGIFQKLGYDNAQLAIESEGLGFALGAVKDASGGSNGELQSLLGSVEAVAAANVLAGTGADKFTQEMARQQDAAGATEAAFALIAEGPEQQFQVLTNSLRNMGLQLGAAVLPGVNSVVTALNANLGPALSAVSAVVGPFISTAVDGFQRLAAAVAGGDAGAAGLPAQFQGIVDVGQQVVAMFNDNIRPAVAQVGAAFLTLGPPLQAMGATILPILTDFGSKLVSVVGPAVTQIGGLISGTLIPAIAGLLPILTPVIGFLLNVVGGALIGVVQGAIDVIGAVITVVAGFINTVVALFTGDWAGAWEGFKSIISGAFDIVKGVVMVFLNLGILKAFGAAFTILRTITTAAWAGIRGLFSSGLNAARSLVSSVLNAIVGFFRGQLSAASSIVRSALDTIRLVFMGVLGGVRQTTSTILSAVAGFFRTQFNNARSTVQSVMGTIRSVVASVLGAIRSTFSSALGAVRSTVQSVMGAIRSVIDGGMNAARSVVSSALSSIRSVVSSGMSSVRSAFSTAMSNVRSAVSNGINAARDAFSTGVGNVVSLARELPGRIVSGLGSLGSKLSSAGRDLIAGLIGGITSKVGDAVSAVRNAVGSVVSGAKSALGIASPSRVFRDQVGAQIGAGLALGIERSSGAVERATRSLVTVPDVPQGLTGSRTPVGAGGLGGEVHQHRHVHIDAREATVRELAARMARDAMREFDLDQFQQMIGEPA